MSGLTLDEFRGLALALPGVEEGVAYGTPIGGVGKRMLTRVWAGGETVVLKIGSTQRETFIATQPDVFSVTDHHFGHSLGLARLIAADSDEIHSILLDGWSIAPRRLLDA